MRLPQDRILHIDTEFKDGKVNVVAEWQGELVRCKDCRYRGKEEYPVCCESADDWYCADGERREE